jgi:transcriptional/translational regulatory protein YebC/TACO1
VLQKNGGRLGESGSVTHMFNNYGIIQFEKNKISEEEAFEIAINAGAKDCVILKDNFEIITDKEDFYKVKTELEKKIDIFSYCGIEWRTNNYIDLNKEKSDKIFETLSALEELDDVQNIFSNANLEKIQI